MTATKQDRKTWDRQKLMDWAREQPPEMPTDAKASGTYSADPCAGLVGAVRVACKNGGFADAKPGEEGYVGKACDRALDALAKCQDDNY